MRFDFDQYGNAFVAMRLHRVRTIMSEQFDKLFEQHGINIPTACISVLLFLAQEGRASIAGIARSTGYSHQLINQRLLQLERLSLVVRSDDKRDGRKRIVHLTREGKREAVKVETFLDTANLALDDLFAELDINLYELLAKTENALESHPLTSRVDSSIKKQL